MQTIVSAKEMQWCDSTTIHRYGVPGIILMENAGRGAADIASRRYGPLGQKQVVVLCGKGNNGGDGFVIARHLLNTGANVTAILLAPASQLDGDARANARTLQKLAPAFPRSLRIVRYSKATLSRILKPDLVIDALFGTGFSGEVAPSYAHCIAWINQQKCPVLSVDIPSGVNGTSGIASKVVVNAQSTVTFGLRKTGLLCNQGQDCAGEVDLVDIGIPGAVSRAKRLMTCLVEPDDITSALPKRPSAVHKYSVGKVLVLAGSKGYTGAAYLCALAALRAGAGAVMLAIPESVYQVIARRLAEAIVIPLPSTSVGSLSVAALPTIEEKLKWCDVVVLGPGLSTNAETQEVVRFVLANYRGKMVVDADALRTVGEMGLRRVKRAGGEFLLTPHAGEYSRILGETAGDIEENRIEAARKGSTLSGAVIILKGGPTATGLPDGRVVLNSTGNPGMATVGSGDVLAGIVGSLWAQGMQRDAAAYAGVYLHGLSGDIAKEIHGERSIVASDLIDQLPSAIRRVERL